MSNSFAMPWTVSRQRPLSMGFPRHEDWSGLPFPSPGDLPDPGIEPASPTMQANSLPLNHQGSPEKVLQNFNLFDVLNLTACTPKASNEATLRRNKITLSQVGVEVEVESC